MSIKNIKPFKVIWVLLLGAVITLILHLATNLWDIQIMGMPIIFPAGLLVILIASLAQSVPMTIIVWIFVAIPLIKLSLAFYPLLIDGTISVKDTPVMFFLLVFSYSFASWASTKGKVYLFASSMLFMILNWVTIEAAYLLGEQALNTALPLSFMHKLLIACNGLSVLVAFCSLFESQNLRKQL